MDKAALEQRVIAALQGIYDPEIPVNIYDLGLVYGIKVGDHGDVGVRMTLPAPGCPVAQTFPGMVEATVAGVEGVTSAKVELTWDPPWSRDRMSETARAMLDI